MIARFFGSSPWGFVLAGTVALGLISLIYGLGYHHARGTWQARYEARENALRVEAAAETARQQSANDAAKAAEAENLLKLAAFNETLNTQIEELSREADNDPDRDRFCLSAGSVQRINKIGR